MPKTKTAMRLRGVLDAFTALAVRGEGALRMLAGVLLCLLLLLGVWRVSWAASQPRQEETGLWRFETAEVARSEARKRPPPGAEWKEVRLPESWRETQPGYVGQVWYRMSIDLATVRNDPYAIYLPHRRAQGLLFFVNGVLIGNDLQRTAFAAWYSPQYFVVPPSLLRTGTNLIEIAMIGNAEARNGLGRVAFGYENPVRQLHRWQNNIENTWSSGQMFTLFGLGLLGLVMWLARREDRLMFWFMLGCLTWSLLFALRVATLGLGNGTMNQVTGFVTTSLTPLFSVILCLRIANRRRPVFEAVLWVSFFSAVAWILADPSGQKPLHYWQNSYTTLVAVSACWLLMDQRRKLGWSLYVFVASMVLSVFFPLHDILRDRGILDLDRASLRLYQVVDLVIGLGAIVFERYLAGTKATEKMNVELERRVAEKTAQIEDATRRMQAIRDEQALAKERERILADMHDGVGASLVALTQVAEDDGIPRRDLARRAKDALQDLRMAIDSLEPYEGDLATVLGNMRERLDQSVRAAGVKLEWAVGDLPPMKSLTPSIVLDIQRVVYEAVTNAVRHAEAASVKVAAMQLENGAVRIQVADDGKGFDADAPAGGRGLRNLRRRAERLGATFAIASGKSGTVVTLDLHPADEPARFPAGELQLQQA